MRQNQSAETNDLRSEICSHTLIFVMVVIITVSDCVAVICKRLLKLHLRLSII